MSKQMIFEAESFFIIENKVHQVFLVEKQKEKDQTERIIHYRPYFLDNNNKTLVCSIPESNLPLLKPCKPISKKEMSKILQFEVKQQTTNSELNLEEAQSALDSNDTNEIAKVLKLHWIHKKKKEGHISKSLNNNINNLINRMAEELALLDNTSREQATKKIISALNNE